MNRMYHVTILIVLTGCQGPLSDPGLTSDGGITGTGRPDDPIRIADRGVTNGQLAHSDLSVAAMAPLVADNRVELGGTLMLSCPTCVTGMGTAGALAKFMGASVLGKSVIVEDGDKVGVGTMNPGEKLTLPFNGRIGFEYSSAGNNALHSIGLNGSDGTGSPLEFKARYGAVRANPAFAFYGTPGGTETQLVTILNGGEVGLGTDHPQRRLHVAGDILLEGTGNQLMLNDPSNAIYTDGNGIAVNAGSKERLRVTPGGNVGIGTVSPFDKLTVTNGNIRAERANSGDSTGMLIASDGTVDVAPCDRAKQGGMTFIQDGGINRGHFFGCRGPVTIMGTTKYCWVRLDDQEGTQYPPSPARCTNWP